jgi:hypothetical protein
MQNVKKKILKFKKNLKVTYFSKIKNRIKSIIKNLGDKNIKILIQNNQIRKMWYLKEGSKYIRCL